MHDTYLLHNISDELMRLCKESNIAKVNQVIIGVNPGSHINNSNLLDYLNENHREIVGSNIELIIRKEDIEEHTAIIHNVIGESIVQEE